MALSLGSAPQFSKVGTQEFYVPARNESGGLIGVFRIIITALEVAVAFIPGIGPELSAAIGVGFAGAQATLTGVSYAEGNIRSTGQLFGALTLDVVPSLAFVGKALRTEAIVVEELNTALETQKVNRVYAKKTTEYKDTMKMLKSEGMRRTGKIETVNGTLTRTKTVRSSELAKYRTAYIKAQAKLGQDTSMIAFDDFEVRMNNLIDEAKEKKYGYYFNNDRALLRRLKYSKNLLAANPDRYEDLINLTFDTLSRDTQNFIRQYHGDPIKAIKGLTEFTESRKLTSRINKIFASGESDWASKEFWQQVRNGKILKSSNFYTQAAQALNANDVGRELITKPFNALIRKNKQFMDAYRKKWIKKYSKTKAAKFITKEEKLRRDMQKYGKYWGGSLVLGYRVLQDLGGTKTIQIHFNKMNTNALTPGSKNHGGKKDVIIPITNHDLKKWGHSANKSAYYLRHFALSRGGKPIGYEVSSEIFSNFLSFVPLPALRNVLSVVSNIKSVGKDIAAGRYAKEWWGDFEKTVKRLWIHKVGKLAGSSLGIFGKGIGKEGQRIGLGIAKGFQHRGGQSLGRFNARGLLKETAPTAFRGTVLRGGQRRIKAGHHRGIGQAKLSVGRYGTNLRRITGIPKI